jgi:integrase
VAWIEKVQREGRQVSWRVRWRDPATGQKRHERFDRKIDAERRLAILRAELFQGTYFDPSAGRELVGDFLERMLEAPMDLRASTVALYRTQARRYVVPRLGAIQLSAVRPAHVRALLGELASEGVGTATIEVVHRLISRTFAQAVADGILPANPAARARPPRAERSPIRILTPEEVEVLAAAVQPRARCLVLVGAYAGLRFGEATALRRPRLRLLERRVEILEGLVEVGGHVIGGPLKTHGSRRTVTIPRFLVDELAAHVATYPDRGGSDLVFTAPEGGSIRRTNFRRRVWEPAVRAAGLDPPPRFHDLRHTAAALMIAAGAHPKAIQSRLGHSSIRTTLDVYGHLFPQLDEDLANELDMRRRLALEAAAPSVPPGSPAAVVPIRGPGT